ncbi:hypothetical protein COCMIDRAFT_41290 [Bipolaris oryzae ATCC 44560]|uniref:Uncharacterized protein n=1 Tax=Bipolaris oryzae ATCC 44560 TaxID=930090 RepID=W6YM93_COCMI|nr:uncharacterized protein COCMIDRAFT_41290 [Bipolaris oryzae ATCC 44560]EUC40367.1 hypothetical protein COCMIDRAFT_41290 [Bipolaris oryzae ATCC 44560]
MASDYSVGIIHGRGGWPNGTSPHSKAGGCGSGVWDAERDILGWAIGHGLEQTKAAMVHYSGSEGGLQGAQCRHKDAKDLDGGDKSVGVVTVLARQICWW